jgi:hypothetical protein
VAFIPGVYIEYGLGFLDCMGKKYPRTDECVIFGDNPGMSQEQFKRFQSILNKVAAVLRDPLLQQEIEAGLDQQLRCLEGWTERSKLVKRVRSRKPFEMLINRPQLGLPV